MMAKKKILVIDDEKNLCTLIKSNLEHSGEYEVTTACSGQEGLIKAKDIDFDLVITDFKMPGMNGREVLDILKETKPNLPIVFFSVYLDDTTTIRALDLAKVDGIITKPFETEQLYKTIKDVLDKSEKKKQ